MYRDLAGLVCLPDTIEPGVAGLRLHLGARDTRRRYAKRMVQGRPDGDRGAACRASRRDYGLTIPCIVSQLTKALNQPVLVVVFLYIPKP